MKMLPIKAERKADHVGLEQSFRLKVRTIL